jgi:hypothetical protein|tara:strand:+ start:275 stop:406 length:132 start_codon:yes stop_codon:yes gene_type:complete
MHDNFSPNKHGLLRLENRKQIRTKLQALQRLSFAGGFSADAGI